MTLQVQVYLCAFSFVIQFSLSRACYVSIQFLIATFLFGCVFMVSIICLFSFNRMTTPHSTNNRDKGAKPVWDYKATEYFVKACLSLCFHHHL